MPDEIRLVRRCLRGDDQAFAEIVDRHKVMVYSIVARVVQDSGFAEDLAQEVFLRVYRGLQGFRRESKLSTWIYKIAYRVCLAELERPHRQQYTISLDGVLDDAEPISIREPVPVTDRAFDQIDLSESLDHWLGTLPPHYRMAITLYYLGDRSYLEIAEVMGVPIGTVKTYLHRAKRALKDRILREGKAV